MKKISTSLDFFLKMAKVQAIMSRKFDSKLGGLGLNEFIILYNLSQAEGGEMRRVDLAEKIGLTASGVTRLLLPMEKIGLVKRRVDQSDARVSSVAIASGGKQKLDEALERAEIFCEDVIPDGKARKIEEFSKALADIGEDI